MSPALVGVVTDQVTEVELDPAAIRSKVLCLMVQHTAIAPRGFDSIRERADLHKRIDVLLDRHALASSSFDDLPVA